MAKSEIPTSVVYTCYGPVVGSVEVDLNVFRGVPYASPPLGSRRFRRSVAPTVWSEPFAAIEHGPVAPQTPSRLETAMGAFDAVQDEDCLTLTIWAPRSTSSPTNVLIWFHGGGYSSGAGSLDFYCGAELASKGDIVVVNVNYRLGALGFLYLPEIGDANAGLYDQLDALVWVHRNISAFGGDPDKVTVMGQSAGAYSIALLSRIPAAATLYRQMILMSPPLGMSLATADESEHIAGEFLAELGLGRESLQSLWEIPVKELLEAQNRVTNRLAVVGNPTPPFRPVDVFPDLSGVPFSFADPLPRSCFVGFTSDEMLAFLVGRDGKSDITKTQALSIFEAYHGENALYAYENYIARISGSEPCQIVASMASDMFFTGPTIAYARTMNQVGIDTYVYEFSWSASDSKFGACHCIELPFVFGTFSAFSNAAMLESLDMLQARQLADAVQDIWISFIRDGAPKGISLESPCSIPVDGLRIYRISDSRFLKDGAPLELPNPFLAKTEYWER